VRPLRFLEGVEKVAAALLVAFILVVQTYSVIMRYAFAQAPSWSEELSAYALVGVVMLSLGRVLRRRGHIRVNLLRAAVSDRVRWALDIVTTLGAMAWAAGLVWGGCRLVADARQIELTSESALRVPLYLPYLLIPVGSAILLLSLAITMVPLVTRSRRESSRTGRGRGTRPAPATQR
jgi:TRAP-type C4-dicarboxylate transport system permease small subunit